MKTIPAGELKRRGISVVDEILKEGPVHVIKNNQPKYVIMDEEYYSELVDENDENYMDRLKLSLEDVKAGRIREFDSVADLIKEIE